MMHRIRAFTGRRDGNNHPTPSETFVVTSDVSWGMSQLAADLAQHGFKVVGWLITPEPYNGDD